MSRDVEEQVSPQKEQSGQEYRSDFLLHKAKGLWKTVATFDRDSGQQPVFHGNAY